MFGFAASSKPANVVYITHISFSNPAGSDSDGGISISAGIYILDPNEEKILGAIQNPLQSYVYAAHFGLY